MCVDAMTQSVILSESRALEAGFSIGICAADRAANLNRLLEVVKSESFPNGLILRKIVLVASGCELKALAFARQLAYQDSRLLLIEEPARRGKWAAINQIIDNLDGQFLVLVNSDALPEHGAISNLLHVIIRDDNVGMVSASPIVGERVGITGGVLQLMWGVHNECLLELNEGDQNNHGCDELIVVRSDVLRKLPPNTVNDGAYLAGNAHLAGYSIRFCESAKVKIDVPHSFVDLMRQRRRIIYGHFQIWKSVGESPRTLESMLLGNPLLSFSILIKTLAKSPRLVFAMPVALIGEAVSVILAIYDNLTSSKKHAMWDRFGSRS